MDRTLKERIIGAIVLVALVVLVVPVFLDGPPAGTDRISERVALPGQSEQQTQTVVLERTRDEPMPSRPDPSGNEAVAEPATVVDATGPDRPDPAAVERAPTRTPESIAARPAVPDKTDERLPAPSVASVSATGMFAVQLGSFSNQQNAERLAADLRKQGFAAFLSQLGTAEGQLHRVRVGPQKDREAAEAMAARLAKAGHKGTVLPHP